MRTFVALVIFILTLAAATRAIASAVHVEMVDDAGFSKWIDGESMPVEEARGEWDCGTVKFNKCSDCNRVVVSDDTGERPNVELKFSGEGFHRACEGGGFTTWGGSPDTRATGGACSGLGTGGNCYASIEFCPQQAGTTSGTVTITVKDGKRPKSYSYNLVGHADYSRELEDADRVRREHLPELLKVKHVKQVELHDGHEVRINVEVDTDDSDESDTDIKKDIAQVRREVPPWIDGYKVEVTEYIGIGCGM